MATNPSTNTAAKLIRATRGHQASVNDLVTLEITATAFAIMYGLFGEQRLALSLVPRPVGTYAPAYFHMNAQAGILPTAADGKLNSAFASWRTAIAAGQQAANELAESGVAWQTVSEIQSAASLYVVYATATIAAWKEYIIRHTGIYASTSTKDMVDSIRNVTSSYEFVTDIKHAPFSTGDDVISAMGRMSKRLMLDMPAQDDFKRGTQALEFGVLTVTQHYAVFADAPTPFPYTMRVTDLAYIRQGYMGWRHFGYKPVKMNQPAEQPREITGSYNAKNIRNVL